VTSPDKIAEWNNAGIVLGIQLRHRSIGPNQIYQVILVSGVVGIDSHGAKFPQHERLAAKSDSLLLQNHWAGGYDLHNGSYEQENRQKDR
jgi:hypothetical protein